MANACRTNRRSCGITDANLQWVRLTRALRHFNPYARPLKDGCDPTARGTVKSDHHRNSWTGRTTFEADYYPPMAASSRRRVPTKANSAVARSLPPPFANSCKDQAAVAIAKIVVYK